MIKGIHLYNNNDLKELYNKIKPKYKNTNIILINASLIYGLEHIKGILRIINEEISRKNFTLIKNNEIEFLLRLCHTNQILNAFKIIKDSNIDNNIVVILFAKSLIDFKPIVKEIKINGVEDDTLINASDFKKTKITNMLFDKNIKDKNIHLFKDEDKFINILIERSALAVK